MFTSHHLSVTSIACLSLILLTACDSPELPTDGGQDNSTIAASPSGVSQQSSTEIEADSEVAQNNDNIINLRDVIDTWESGAQDQAIGKMLLIDWGGSTALDNIPAMSLTENDFKALARGERIEQQAAAMKLAGTAKAISRHSFSLAEKANADGDNEKAKQYYQGTQRLGAALAGADRIAVLQMTGKALVQMAEEKVVTQQ